MADLRRFVGNSTVGEPQKIQYSLIFWWKIGEGAFTETKAKKMKFEGNLDLGPVQGPFVFAIDLLDSGDKGKCRVKINGVDETCDFEVKGKKLVVSTPEGSVEIWAKKKQTRITARQAGRGGSTHKLKIG